jgi:Raf kinase inhibitor-like YbhB/YbcL family protein
MLKKILLLIFICISSMEATMKLISPAFSHNESIPTKYTCDGENISPALAWSDAPAGTQSFALIVDDPDAPKKVWVHWIVFNIPVTVEHIIENQGATGEEVAFTQGSTDFNSAQKWGGPCPPSGTHRYHFTLYALDTMLDLPAGATKEELLSAMHGHILEKTTLIGTYQHKK